MGEAKRNWREDLKVMRERMGGVSAEKKAWSKQQRAELKAIREALRDGPLIVPEVAARTNLPSPSVLWYVMALKRYGKVAEAGLAGEYYRYEWKEGAIVSVRVDPQVTAELSYYGGDTAVKCFNCGNCTAACSLTNQDSVFPRRYIRYTQLGLKRKMVESLDPWLCYYCGDCSETCPREAQPGKLMMAGRRWLIGNYDWTGMARMMYRRDWMEVVMLVAVALLVVGLFTLPGQFGFGLLASHPEARRHVQLQYFAPKEVVHLGDLVLASLLGLLLMSNAARMAWYVRRHAPPAPASAYVAALREFAVQALTQKRWRDCTTDSTRHWLRHLILVTAYGTMLVLVVIFLYWFQVEDTSFHWTSLLGYYATLVLLGATLWIMRDRAKKKDQIHKYSDLADWLFVILLFLTSLSGILLHLARLLDAAMAVYALYVAHLAIAVSMLTVEVPFGKWSHLLYRPLAMYLIEVQKRAPARETAVPGAYPATAA